MLPDVTLPASLAGLLWVLRPVFTAPSFATFCVLVAGLAGQVRRRTVCGMLLGACLGRPWPHDRAHYFFARACWDLDELGLAVARLVVGLLVPAGAAASGPGCGSNSANRRSAADTSTAQQARPASKTRSVICRPPAGVAWPGSGPSRAGAGSAWVPPPRRGTGRSTAAIPPAYPSVIMACLRVIMAIWLS